MSTLEVKSAVRTALADQADELGRENNVVVFGLKEDEGEKVGEKVSGLFQELGVKPRFEAKRVGVVKTGVCRPVRVVLRTRVIAKQVLSKAAKLRGVEGYESVFLSHKPAQRDQRRLLVTLTKWFN